MTQFQSAADEAIARTQIAYTMALYNAHVDIGAIDRIMEAFDRDAHLKTSGGEHTGFAAIRAFYDGVLGSGRMDPDKPLPLIRHNLTTHFVEFNSAEEATGRTYFTVTSSHGLDHTGVYSDVFAKKGDRWLIVRRTITVEYFASPSWFEERRLRAGTTPKLG